MTFCSTRCAANNQEVRNKFKNTCIDKYGTDNPSKSDKISSKISNSLKELYANTDLSKIHAANHFAKHGVSNPAQRPEVRQLLSSKVKESYTPELRALKSKIMSSETVQKKTKETNMNKYNTPCTFNIDPLGNTKKRQQTNMKKYGTKEVLSSVEIQNKIKETNMKKYGVVHTSSKHILHRSDLNETFVRNKFIIADKFDNKAFLEYFNMSITYSQYFRIKYNITNKTIGGFGKTESELGIIFDIRDFNNRTFIAPLEIDLIDHTNKICIEYNGLMWHSFGKSKYSMFDNSTQLGIGKNKHLNKTNNVENNGYQLFHIFENEWLDPTKRSIWTSLIKSKQHKSEKKVGARKCKVQYISSSEANLFCDTNHLQGRANSSVNIGLEYNGVLIAVMTFCKSRLSKQFEYELLRMCSKINYNVQGGFSKMLNFFEKNNNPKSLVSYANRRWSTGSVYVCNGFTFSHNSDPTMAWFTVKSMKLESRFKFQKHKLSNIDGFVFNPTHTAQENMFDNNYRIIYDSGHKVYYKLY